MTILAQDPSVRDKHGRVIRARVGVPADHLEPGPRGHRLHVVDYDATTGTFHPPMGPSGPGPGDPTGGWAFEDPFAEAQDPELLSDFRFHAQNVYAIAARTLGAFESALGRRIPWSFGGHELYLCPHALAEANAYYADDDRALYFGYVPDPSGETVYSCLSHDIVAHETAHALLDGFRPRFQEPSLPDQAAFHEAFADIVALLSVFSTREVVEHLLGDADRAGRIPAERVSQEELERSALFKLAEQMGDALHAERGSGLRRSVALRPTSSWKTDRSFEAPHRRGEILVAAFTQTLLRMWRDRLTPIIHGGGVDRSRAAEEGAKSADHLLKMAIRSLDYTPPIEFEFADFLEAMWVSDAELVPDDAHGYRGSLLEAFQSFGIDRPTAGVVDLSQGPHRPRYQHLNFASLRNDRDEVFRFLWDNADLLGISRSYYTQVERVRPAVRVGPDGFVVVESVADYIQMLSGTAAELAEVGLSIPQAIADNVELRLWGGGALVFDQFGGPKYHHPKPLDAWERQSRRLEYLHSHGLRDRGGRLGFSFGTSRGRWFAEFHRPRPQAEEGW